MSAPALPAPEAIAADVRRALAEDLLPRSERGRPLPATPGLSALDPSLRWVDNAPAAARLVAKSAGVLCGTAWFDECHRQVDRDTGIEWHIADGQEFGPDSIVAHISGQSHSLLLAERSGLNFLQLLSGGATMARRFAAAIAGHPGAGKTRLLDTRKTLPGLRAAQKYAVVCGGGRNHRFGLYDAVMIKDNHLHSILAGLGADGGPGIDAEEWRGWRRENPGLEVVIEVEDLATLDKALALKPDRVLLDNASPETLKEMAGRARDARIETEASGNISLASLPACLDAGVDYVSVGALTKDVEAIDFSLRMES